MSAFRVGSIAKYRDPPPVFGRVLHNEPIKPHKDAKKGRARSYGYKDVSGNYDGNGNRQRAWTIAQSGMREQPARRRMQFRFSGGGKTSARHGSGDKPNSLLAATIGQKLLSPQKGSFQKLKELVWTERARELTRQRKTEEMIARAAVIKEITNGQR